MSTTSTAANGPTIRVMMSRVADYIADAIGVRFDRLTAKVKQPPVVAGPLGLRIPTQFDFSHGTQQATYLTVCWKVSGDLYAAVSYEPDTKTTTVALLDKARWKANPQNEANFISAKVRGEKSGAWDTLEGYLAFWGDALVAAWSRGDASKEWVKLEV